ncbi:hypothetical protein G7043_25630 [Lentzea sp. NEAU-D13]|uniref:PET hydrolase/cutinase-like domain-containing protein n=1 Tax=Lentzea alba TaxID=2714351 RepID=A0A7C9RTA0_9PSEU|nr:hypothetical protein [Lentzea alba]NGY62309.1 hypothetical protein [Lentzea alba]
MFDRTGRLPPPQVDALTTTSGSNSFAAPAEEEVPHCGQNRPAETSGIACAATLGVLASTVNAGPASAADNPFQRGPIPTQASVAASRGTFATAETSLDGGDRFGGAKICHPTDTSRGKFAALAVSPGYAATWAEWSPTVC